MYLAITFHYDVLKGFLILLLLLLLIIQATEDDPQHRPSRKRSLHQLCQGYSQLVPSSKLANRLALQPQMARSLLLISAESTLRILLPPNHHSPFPQLRVVARAEAREVGSLLSSHCSFLLPQLPRVDLSEPLMANVRSSHSSPDLGPSRSSVELIASLLEVAPQASQPVRLLVAWEATVSRYPHQGDTLATLVKPPQPLPESPPDPCRASSRDLLSVIMAAVVHSSSRRPIHSTASHMAVSSAAY